MDSGFVDRLGMLVVMDRSLKVNIDLTDRVGEVKISARMLS